MKPGKVCFLLEEAVLAETFFCGAITIARAGGVHASGKVAAAALPWGGDAQPRGSWGGVVPSGLVAIARAI